MSQLAAILGKLGPKLSGLMSGAQRGGQGKGLSDLLQMAADRENAAGNTSQGQSFGSLAGIAGSFGDAAGTANNAMQTLGGIATASSPTRAASQGLRAVGDAAGGIGGAIGGAVGGPAGAAVGGAIGDVVGALPKFAAELIETIDKIRSWGKELHSANMQFAEFSASMARVQAESEVNEFYLKRQQGENRAGSAGFLAGGNQMLDQTMAPLEDLWANMQNYFEGFLTRGVAVFIQSTNLPFWANFANWLMGVKGGGDDNIDASQWTWELGEEALRAQGRRPPGMR